MEWPETFYAQQRGEGCPMCEEGRPDQIEDAVRYFEGEVTDAYLRKAQITSGLSVVIWRGRHVSEPTELSDEEAATFWRELLRVGAAIEAVFRPVKVNYNILGNSIPHLHAHIVPRYEDDPRPGWPFPFPEEDPPPMVPAAIRAQVGELRTALE